MTEKKKQEQGALEHTRGGPTTKDATGARVLFRVLIEAQERDYAEMQATYRGTGVIVSRSGKHHHPGGRHQLFLSTYHRSGRGAHNA